MPAQDHLVTTIDELLALPEDGLRHELLEGEHVVTPAPMPRHQFVLQDIYMDLRNAIATRDDIEVVLSPADIVLDPTSLVQPDLFVITKPPDTIVEKWSDVGIPILTVEVLSPTTASRDRGKKRAIYQRAGIAEYWIVDLDARIVERWTPNDQRPAIDSGPLSWVPPGGSAVIIDIATIFSRRLSG